MGVGGRSRTSVISLSLFSLEGLMETEAQLCGASSP